MSSNIEREMVHVDTSTPKRPRLRIEYPNGHIVDLLPHNAWHMGTWLDGHQPYAVHEDGEWKAKRLMRTELEYGRWVLPGLPKRVVSTEQVHAMTRSLGCRVRMLVDDVDDADERDQSYTRLLNAIRYAQAAGNHIRGDRAHSSVRIRLDHLGQARSESTDRPDKDDPAFRFARYNTSPHNPKDRDGQRYGFIAKGGSPQTWN